MVRNRCALPVAVLPVVALLLHLGAVRAVAQPTGGTTTVTSVVEFHTNNIVTTRKTASVQTYATQIDARMQGGPVLFSLWLAVTTLDPQFSAALLQAQAALTAAGAVGVTGPTLLSSENVITDVSTTTVRTGYTDLDNLRDDQIFVGTLEWVGPDQFVAGYFGVCTDYTLLNRDISTAFYVLPTGCTGAVLNTITVDPGDTVLETRAAFFLDPLETETTTTTSQLRQRFELVGTPATTTVPEPSSLVLLVTGAALLLARQRMRRSPRPE
jgi:hypothetical protein